jgi:wobble nucleotide-excising tRNase
MKNEDRIVELLTELVQRMDSKEVADQRRFEAIDKRFENIDKRFENIDKRFETIEGELKESNRILISVANVVSNLVLTNQAGYVELSEKVRRLEEKVYGQVG